MNIFEFAKEKEKLSENYYRQLAGKAANKGLQNIFNMLAGEEARHYRIIEAMQKKQAQQVSDSPILTDAKKVFEAMRASAEHFNFDIGQVQLYEKARQIEIESEKFYREKAGEVQDEQQKNVFKKLAALEHKHYILLENICSFVEKPQYFLENAEMYRFDDYAEGAF
jgi:rubrerythrin